MKGCPWIILILAFSLNLNAQVLTPTEVQSILLVLNSPAEPKTCDQEDLPCPKPLLDLVNDDSKGGAIGFITGHTPWSACHQEAVEKSTVSSREMVEAYEGIESLRLGSGHASLIGRCLSYNAGISENQKKSLVAKYYYLQNRIEEAQLAVLSEIAAMDTLSGRAPLDGLNCELFDLARSRTHCTNAKKCIPPENLKQEFDRRQITNFHNYATLKKTKLNLERQLHNLRTDESIRGRGRRSEQLQQIEALRKAIDVLRIQIEYFETQSPWFKSKHLSSLDLDSNLSEADLLKKLDEGTRAYMAEARSTLLKRSEEWRKLSACIGGRADCSTHSMQAQIEDLPPYKISYDFHSPNDSLRVAYLALDRAVCLSDMVESRREANARLNKAGFNALLFGVSGAFGWLANASRLTVAARTINLTIDSAWLSDSIIEATRNCLDESITVSASPLLCGEELSQNFSRLDLHDRCMSEFAWAALDAIPFIPTAVRNGLQRAIARATPPLNSPKTLKLRNGSETITFPTSLTHIRQHFLTVRGLDTSRVERYRKAAGDWAEARQNLEEAREIVGEIKRTLTKHPKEQRKEVMAEANAILDRALGQEQEAALRAIESIIPFARPGKSTSITLSSLEDIIEQVDLKDSVRWYQKLDDPSRFYSPAEYQKIVSEDPSQKVTFLLTNHAYSGRIETPRGTYEYNVILCNRPECEVDGATIKFGEVLTFYLNCGPDVFTLEHLQILEQCRIQLSSDCKKALNRSLQPKLCR